MRLIDPCKELIDRFFEMKEEYREMKSNRYENITKDNYNNYIDNLIESAHAVDKPDRVPSNTYWLVDENNKILGVSRFRHYLVPHLEKEGGHIGYEIVPSMRRKGYGKEILRLTLKKAWDKNLNETLITCDSDNTGSEKIIRHNGGEFIDKDISDNTGKEIYRFRIKK